MKKILVFLFIFFSQKFYSQQGMYRHFPQTQANYFKCEMNVPVKTSDNGYIFSFFPWSPNTHGLYPVDHYTIKTDSNFVPQWKKPFNAAAISLPTGGIIICYSNIIEKVTVSGTVVWAKNISDNSLNLNDGVAYSNKIRFVGLKAGDTGYPYYSPTSQPYSLEIDTLGNLISQTLFNPSYGGDADFSKIKRDNQGNFYVYSTPNGTSPSNMSLAKFNSSFNLIWAKKWSQTNQLLLIRDIDILSNGRIFASGEVVLNSPSIFMHMGALLKFDTQGNLIQQKYFDGSFRWNGSGNYQISGLCKKPNGNYIVSEERTMLDSIITFETDTSMNIIWNKFCARGVGVGTSIIKNSNIYTPIFRNSGPIILSTNLNGVGCSSYNAPYTQLPSSVTITSFSLIPVVVNAALINSISSATISQTYIDSCMCPVSIQGYQNAVCVGGTSTITILGTGLLSWYATSTGSSFIQSGPQFICSSNTPTTKIIYAQDSACTMNPIRTAITINFYAVPTLTFSPANPTICPGNQIFLSVSGAINYTWSCNSLNTSVQSLNPLVTTNYTVTGSLASGCIDTKTISLIVIPTLTVSASPSIICIGTQATVSVIGANSYTWNNGSNASSFTILPTPGVSNYSVIGQVGNCYGTNNFNLLANSVPTINILSSQSIVCLGDSITLTASGANLFTWNNFSNSNFITITPTANIVYSVTGSNIYSCTSSSTIGINPFPNPTLTIISSNPIICAGEISVLGVAGASTYIWSNSNTGSNITINPTISTVFSVTGTDSNGCKSSISITQTVDACLGTGNNDSFSLSNFIYPNPTNGHFYISFNSSENYKNLEIYNAIGERVLYEEIQSLKPEFDISNFPRGLYELRLYGDSKILVTKIIKQD